MFQLIAGWLKGRLTWQRGIAEEKQFILGRRQEGRKAAKWQGNKQQVAAVAFFAFLILYG